MADGTAEIFAGGLFDQERIVNQAEGLQDFRRRQEGHLIIADDRPLLVMSFGTKFSGANASKYKIEGKFDIPVGYKVIIKWDEDEVVFMTRQGTFGPEFQIVYLPKSPIPEDFTMFEWNANIAEIWDQFLTVIEGHEDRDMRLFHQGPWRAFGVTRVEVQDGLKMGADNSSIVDGILHCENGVNPSIKEYMIYLLGKNDADESDEDVINYTWVITEFMTEPLPPGFVQCVREGGMVCWADAHTQETTWKHPHYDKYNKMLKVARNQKPVVHWKSIAAFRIEFLLSSIFTWEVEATGDYPIVETVENVTEMARIFGVDILNEPYLVHVLKRALRHYGHAVREKRPVKDVQDFQNLMQRYRDMVGQFEQMREEEAKRIQKMKVCVQCDERDAVLFCDQCKDFFCQGCFDRLHSKGRRQHHRRSWVEMGVCAECQESVALFHCVQCADLYCRDCYQEWHVRGGRRNHIPIVLRSFNSQAHVLPDATPAMGTGSARVLAQARSPWFTFMDENNVKFYYNIHDGTSRRDQPLATINEPIEEDKGGGLSSGWAGTWGSSMFPDPLPQDHKKTNDMETTF